MKIFNNGNYIEVKKNGDFKIASIDYSLSPGEKNIYEQLLLFASTKEGVNYDDIPSSLKKQFNAKLEKIWSLVEKPVIKSEDTISFFLDHKMSTATPLESQDSNEINRILTINKLRDFGFKEEDYLRIKNVSTILKKSLIKTGITRFSDMYENYKNKSIKKEVQVSRFMDSYIKSNSTPNLDAFKKEIIEAFEFSDKDATNKFNEMLFLSKELKREKAQLDKYKEALKFAKEFKRRGLSDFGFFETILGKGADEISGFGLSSDEIHKLYNRDEQHLVDFFTQVSGRNNEPDAQKIELFVTNYKNSKVDNFPFFQQTCNDYGMDNLSEILRLYNDKIDTSFIENEKDNAIYSMMKMEIMELQKSIIELSIDEGLEIPASLPRVIAPTINFDSEKINPQKILLIDGFDFESVKVTCKGEIFKDGIIDEKYREALDDALMADMKLLNIDVDKNKNIVNILLLKNNGFVFDEMAKWASYDALWDNLDPQRAMGVAVNGLGHCNKLVECGILKSVNNKDFEFRTPRCREILMENKNASYGKLSDIVIKEFSIIESSTERALDKDKFGLEKKAFIEFLDTQFTSYYAPFRKTLDAFIEDTVCDGTLTEELHAFNTLYPELKRGVEYATLVKEYVDFKKVELEEDGIQSVSSRNTLEEIIIEDESLKIMEKLDEETVKFYNEFENFPFEYRNSLDEKFQLILSAAEDKVRKEFVVQYKNNQDFKDLIDLKYPVNYTLNAGFDGSAHSVYKSVFLSEVDMLCEERDTSEDIKPFLNNKREDDKIFLNEGTIFELDSKINNAQARRNEFGDDRESDKFRKIQEEFMNLQAVKRNGVSFYSLSDFSKSAVEKGRLTKEDAEKFIENSLRNAEKLVEIGILQTNDSANFKFFDEKAREILYANFGKGIDIIKAENIQAFNLHSKNDAKNSEGYINLDEYTGCYSEEVHGKSVDELLDSNPMVEKEGRDVCVCG